MLVERTSSGRGPHERGPILLHLRGSRVNTRPVAVQGMPAEDVLQVKALLHSATHLSMRRC